MKSVIAKRSIVIDKHKTSVSLEEAFWKAPKEIAAGRNMALSELVASIDAERQHANLSSAIRLFILGFYKIRLNVATDEQNAPPDVTEARQTG